MADNSTILKLRLFIKKLKSFFFSKDVLSFLLFLSLAAAFWFIRALGKEHETTIELPVRYTGIPQDISVVNVPPASITLTVQDEGGRLFSYRNKELIPISIDVSRVFYDKGEIVITRNQIIRRLSGHVLPTTAIFDIQPDSILIKYEKLSTRVLPVVVNGTYSLASQYELSSPVQVDPAEITVYGPKKMLDTMKVVRTQPIDLKNLSDTTIVRTKPAAVESFRYQENEIKVSFFVEMFTEKTMNLPVTIVNGPENIHVRTFPAVVKATFNIGMSQFNNMSENDLKIYIDYKELKNTKGAKIPLQVENNTGYISNVRILPAEVEFLLEEK